MAKQTDSLICPICLEAYAADPKDKHPTTICKNGHKPCSICANGVDNCPTCSEPTMPVVIVQSKSQTRRKLFEERKPAYDSKRDEINPRKNSEGQPSTSAIGLDKGDGSTTVNSRTLTDVNEAREMQNWTLQDTIVPLIQVDHVKLAARPFGGGTYADVFDGEWNNQAVALKILRSNNQTPLTLKNLSEEARLAMSLNHPNVVRVFGMVPRDGGTGVLMEKADRGSLRSALNDKSNKLSTSQQLSISTDIVKGLEYIHSKQIIHRDLKPENVLLFGVTSRLTAKIADFGESRVMQQSLADTAMVGTPYYMAPELFPHQTQVSYGSKVDVYSLAILLYEVFTGEKISDSYPHFRDETQFYRAVKEGRRPEMSKSFPAELRTVVEHGWSADANVRPALAEFKEALRKLKLLTRADSSTLPIASTTASASASADADTDVCAAFDAQLQKLEQSTKAYKFKLAKSLLKASQQSWMTLPDLTTPTTSSARFHSVKGYIHHWFGECSDAYKETYQALADLHKLLESGTSVEGEVIVTILRHAVAVCWSQDLHEAAVGLLRYAARYAKSKLSATAYADVLECFGYFLNYFYLQRFGYTGFYGEKWRKKSEFVLETRLQASTDKPDVNVATAHFYLALELYREQLDSGKDYSGSFDHLEKALRIINEVDKDNIGAAVCKVLKGEIIRQNQNFIDDEKLEEAKQLQEDALEIAEDILGKTNEVVSTICLRLVSTLEDMERLGDAERMSKRAIKAAEKSLGSKSWLVLDAQEDLADMYTVQLKKYKEAEELYLQSIDFCKSVHGPGHYELSRLYEGLANTYTKWGQAFKASTYSRLKLVSERQKPEDKIESTRKALIDLVNEVSENHENCYDGIVAPEELIADVLSNFFKIAPQPSLHSAMIR